MRILFQRDNLASLFTTINTFDSLQDDKSVVLIDVIYNCITSVLNDAAKLFVPTHKKNFYKFWWNENLNITKQASVNSDKTWKAAGKPHSGPIFERRQACRKQYRALIRQCGKDAELSYTNDLHEALMQKKGTTFWKIWKSKFENKKSAMK